MSVPATSPTPAPHPSKDAPAAPLAQLQEAHDRLKATLEALPDLLFVLDRDGRIYDYHAPRMDRLYVPPERFLGRTMKAVLPEPAAGIVDRAIQDAVAHGHHQGSIYPLSTPDGARWFEISIAAQGDPQTPAGRLIAIARDITERQQAGNALRESEQKYRRLTENMKDVVWVLDVEARRFLYVSPSAGSLRGYTPEEILAQPLEEAWVPEQREELGQLMQRRLAEFLEGKLSADDYVTFEILQPCKDGSKTPSEIVCHLLRNEHTGRIELHGVTRDLTDRRRAEAALRESEARLDQIAAQSRMIVWEVDPKGLYTYISHVAEDVLGYRPEDIVGKLHFYDLHPEEGREAFKAEVFAAFQRHDIFANYENPCRTRDGRTAWVSTNAHPLRNDDGTLRGYRGSDLEITERKQAEEARQASETKYRLLYETMRDALASTDLAGHVLDANPAFLELLGFSMEELRRLTYLDLTPDKWHAVEAKIVAEQVLPRGFSDVYEKECRRKDGQIIPVELRTILIRDDDGQPAGMWAIVRDISERKRAARALQEAYGELEQRVQARTADLVASRQALAQSEAQFRQMTEIIQEVFWLVDAQTGRVLYVSPAFKQIWGRPPRKGISSVHTWAASLHPEDRNRALQAFARGLKTGQFDPLEVRAMRPDGSMRWIEVRGWTIQDAPGGELRIAGVMRDITERRRLEAEILKASETERQRIGRDLHDSLGQSLTGIGYLTEALREELARNARPEAAEAEKLTRLIGAVAGQAHAMSQGLLLMDMKRGGLAPALQELAIRTQELFGRSCHYEGAVEVDLAEADVASQLYRIAQEAATNAAKHGKRGAIEIGLADQPEGLLLSIRDTGRGLPKGIRKTAGMGLDIMRYRAGLIGATLSIDSAPGRGTTVNCRLPRAGPPQETPP